MDCEGREIFKEIRELDGEEGKTDVFVVEMLVILSSSDSSGCVSNNVLFVDIEGTAAVSFDEIKVFIVDVVAMLPEYAEVLFFTVLKTRGDL